MRLLAILFASTLIAQTPKWCEAPPKPQLAALKRVDVNDSWFVVYEPAPGVFAIAEPRQSQGTISYVITGSKQSILFDTGMGIADLKAITTRLTKSPILVMNSHTHHDHVGNNWQFDQVYDMDTAFTRTNAQGSKTEAQAEIAPGQVCGDLPAGFDRAAYATRPWKITKLLHDNDRFDLGGRTIEVIASPGHTPDAICLLDRANGLVFTGDTYYPGTVWLYRDETDLDAYAKTVARLAALTGINTVLGAHGIPTAPPSILPDLLAAFTAVREGKVQASTNSNGRVVFRTNGLAFLMRAP